MSQTSLTFRDGTSMPQLGFGVWQIPQEDTSAAVASALETGFRLIDGAAGYSNEAGMGEGLRVSGVPRSEIFVTTKLANDDHGFDKTLAALDNSLALLGLNYVDLYLVHWPQPRLDLFVETWKALIRIKQDGRARQIGVSNFTQAHLQRLTDETGVAPALNQIELHPRFQQHDMRSFDQAHGIITQSWSPLGRGRLADDPVLAAIAARHGRSWAQIVLRWHLQSGLSIVTKSVTPARIRENFQALSFELSARDMEEIAALGDADGRVGPHPDRQGL